MNVATRAAPQSDIHIGHDKPDRPMAAEGIDIPLATSKHNVRYLPDGHEFVFFAKMNAIGHSRYQPFVIGEKSRPDHAASIGNRMEGAEHADRPFRTPTVHAATRIQRETPDAS